jgi:hypothetical protein
MKSARKIEKVDGRDKKRKEWKRRYNKEVKLNNMEKERDREKG